MNLEKLFRRLERYTDIPRLTFQFEAKEYVYMADTMNHINIILKNISLIEGNKKNLKIYKNDPETIRNIKENIKFSEELIESSLETLEENYLQHNTSHNHNQELEEEL